MGKLRLKSKAYFSMKEKGGKITMVDVMRSVHKSKRIEMVRT